MTLTGFKAQNHPQQTGARGAIDEVDDRGTEPAFVASLEDREGLPDVHGFPPGPYRDAALGSIVERTSGIGGSSRIATPFR